MSGSLNWLTTDVHAVYIKPWRLLVLRSLPLAKSASWNYYNLSSNVKLKWPRYSPGVAQRVGRGIALLFHDRSTRRGWVVSSTPRPHITPEKDPVPILQEAGWVPRPVWTGGKSHPHRDSIPNTFDSISDNLRTTVPSMACWLAIFVIKRLKMNISLLLNEIAIIF